MNLLTNRLKLTIFIKSKPLIIFFQHNFCVKPYVPREPRRDTSNRRLNEHRIYIRHRQESNSQPVSHYVLHSLLFLFSSFSTFSSYPSSSSPFLHLLIFEIHFSLTYGLLPTPYYFHSCYYYYYSILLSLFSSLPPSLFLFLIFSFFLLSELRRRSFHAI